MADLAQPHFVVGFSILAARDVEVEHRVAGRQHLHLKRAVAGPVLIEFDEVGHRGLATGLLRKILAFGNRRLADGSVQNCSRLLLPDLLHHLRKDGADHLRLERALGEGWDFCCHG